MRPKPSDLIRGMVEGAATGTRRSMRASILPQKRAKVLRIAELRWQCTWPPPTILALPLQSPEHHQCIDKTPARMRKGLGQTPDDGKTE